MFWIGFKLARYLSAFFGGYGPMGLHTPGGILYTGGMQDVSCNARRKYLANEMWGCCQVRVLGMESAYLRVAVKKQTATGRG